jgi:prephenate dehydrogenase
MHTVTIIGLGLIGGSLGLALKQQHEASGTRAYHVIGCDQRLERLEQASALGAIDQASASLEESVRQADVITIATPVLAIQQVLHDLAPLLRAGTILTDTASTKVQVMRWAAETLPSSVRFIGGHPMAGSTGSLEEARPDLFHGAAYCLVPQDGPDPQVPAPLTNIIAALGARPILLDAAIHDQAVAAISHLPFLASAALVEALAPADDALFQVMRALASSGFRDATRLAAGDPTMYHDIALTNREAILSWLEAYLSRLHELRALLQSSQAAEDERLQTFFHHARQHLNMFRENSQETS